MRSRCWPVKRYDRFTIVSYQAQTSLNNSLTLPKLSSGPLESRNYEYTQTHSHTLTLTHTEIFIYIYEMLFLFSQCTQVRLIAQETNPRARAPIPCPDLEHPIGPGLAVYGLLPASVCLRSSISRLHLHQPDSSWPQLIWAHLGCKYYNDYRVIGPFGCSANHDQLQRVCIPIYSLYDLRAEIIKN